MIVIVDDIYSISLSISIPTLTQVSVKPGAAHRVCQWQTFGLEDGSVQPKDCRQHCTEPVLDLLCGHA